MNPYHSEELAQVCPNNYDSCFQLLYDFTLVPKPPVLSLVHSIKANNFGGEGCDLAIHHRFTPFDDPRRGQLHCIAEAVSSIPGLKNIWLATHRNARESIKQLQVLGGNLNFGSLESTPLSICTADNTTSRVGVHKDDHFSLNAIAPALADLIMAASCKLIIVDYRSTFSYLMYASESKNPWLVPSGQGCVHGNHTQPKFMYWLKMRFEKLLEKQQPCSNNKACCLAKIRESPTFERLQHTLLIGHETVNY